MKTYLAAYSRDDIARLLPCLWDEEKALNGIPNPLAPDHDMPKGSAPNPKHAGGHMVAVADLRKAWALAVIALGERQAVFLKYGLDSTTEEAAGDLGITERAVLYRIDRAINKLGLFLNGRPFEEEDKDEDLAA